MLDSFSGRIPHGTELTPEGKRILEMDRDQVYPAFHPTKFYGSVGDLRRYGLDIVLHLGYRFGSGDHKIEIVDTAEKSLDGLAGLIERMWRIDSENIEVMRADLAVDVPNIPVSWFREHARFRYKRLASRIDKTSREKEMQFVGMSSAESQTIYAGRRPNFIRIYDKKVELERQWRAECHARKRFNDGLRELDLSLDEIEHNEQPIRSFAEFCTAKNAMISAGAILTRIERQIGGGKIPPQIATLRQLRQLADFDAFSSLEIFATADEGADARPTAPGQPGNAGVSIREHLAGLGFQTLCREKGGVQSAVAYVIKHGNGNGRRVLESLRAYFPSTKYLLTSQDIKAAFRKSIERQFGGDAERKAKQSGDCPTGAQKAVDLCSGPKHNCERNETAREHPRILPQAGQDRSGETASEFVT